MTREEARLYIIRHCNPDYPKGKTEWERAVNMAIKALEQTEQRWIPVTERLPDVDGEYLITKKCFGWDCKEYHESDIAWYGKKGGWHKADEVLAWCELPEPWKEGEADDAE